MEQAGLRLPDIRVTVRDWASACMLVREGMGVALVPESTLPEDRRGLRVMQLTRLFTANSAWSAPRPGRRPARCRLSSQDFCPRNEKAARPGRAARLFETRVTLTGSAGTS
ncbi:hypothetical protein [Massilia sp. CT11-137]|uniref:hypothetical protein n=1 Tax=Massilia sp. CT11-137 TaxID=3393901 RepID=UPI0039AF37C7